jgi:hypothetical protein
MKKKENCTGRAMGSGEEKVHMQANTIGSRSPAVYLDNDTLSGFADTVPRAQISAIPIFKVKFTG